MSCPAAAARFGVSAASAIFWRQLVVQHGTPAAKRQGGDRRAARIDAHAAFILAAIEAEDDITLVELQALLAECGTQVGIGTLWRFFDRHRITRKKDSARHRAGPPRHPEAPGRVVRWAARPRSRTPGLHRRDVGIHQHGASPRSLPTPGAAALGRATRTLEDHHPRRQPAPHRHGGADGTRRPDQPRRLRRLCPPGARARPLARRHRHHGQPFEPQGARRARRHRSGGRQAALPSAPRLRRGRLYSPDFSPIEQAFTKLKANLRKAAERTIHGLWDAIGRILDLYSPQECANYFANAGYDAD